MNIGQALVYGQKELKNSDSPYLDTRLILEFITQVSHGQLIADPDRVLYPVETNLFLELVHRAARFEPIPYLLRSAPFYGNEFIVSPSVLIPRPETELLIDSVVEYLWETGREDDKLTVVDVGTGSGNIAITLAKMLPKADIVAIDISKEALILAKQNADWHGVANRIGLIHGDLLLPIDFEPDLIVANLPYVAEDEWSLLDRSVRLFEPEIALNGGNTGMKIISDLLDQAEDQLVLGGAIFLEIGWQQGTAVRQLAASVFPRATISVRSDLSDLDRIVSIETSPE